jgi:hypothetical protein
LAAETIAGAICSLMAFWLLMAWIDECLVQVYGEPDLGRSHSLSAVLPVGLPFLLSQCLELGLANE